MDKIERILFINSLYYPENRGGAQNSVQILAETLNKMGYQVYVLCNNGVEKSYTHNGVYVISTDKILNYSYGERERKGNLEKCLWHFRDSTGLFNSKKIERIIHEIDPDIINTNIIAGFSIGIISLIEKLGIKHVHTVRDYYLLCLYANMYKDGSCNKQCLECKLTSLLKRNHFKKIKSFIFISRSLKKIHEKYLQVEYSSIIYNPLLNSNNNTSVKTKSNSDELTVGYIGRLHSTKGVEVLIDAVSKMKRPFKLIIAGEGEQKYKESIFSILDSHSVEYEHLGFVKPESFYEKVDINVVPSLWEEPFGRVVIESLQYNTPVVLSDLDSFKEFINDNDAIFFKRGQSSDLLDKLENFRSDSNVIDFEYYRNKFSPEEIASQYLSHFNGI